MLSSNRNKASLPSVFLKKCGKQKTLVKVKERVYSIIIVLYDRDIVCLPQSYAGKSKVIPIPRNRDELLIAGLAGKITHTSDISEEVIFDEIHNVFRVPMKGNALFEFAIHGWQ